MVLLVSLPNTIFSSDLASFRAYNPVQFLELLPELVSFWEIILIAWLSGLLETSCSPDSWNQRVMQLPLSLCVYFDFGILIPAPFIVFIIVKSMEFSNIVPLDLMRFYNDGQNYESLIILFSLHPNFVSDKLPLCWIGASWWLNLSVLIILPGSNNCTKHPCQVWSSFRGSHVWSGGELC